MAPTLTWSGPIVAGDQVIITYTVTVTNLGDHVLENTASVPGCDDPTCNPPPVVAPLPHVVPTKSSSPASGVGLNAGDIVTYTLSWTNDGEAAGVVDATDDLSDIVDDADVISEPVSDDPAVTATRNGTQIRVTGPIAVDATITVTYQVRIKPDGQRGNNVARNVLTPDTPQVTCDLPMPAGGVALLAFADDCQPVVPPTTDHPIAELDDWKTVDPASGTSVQAGRTVSFTLHFANTGQAPVSVNREDILSGVIDDATLTSGPTASNAALAVSAVSGGRFTITGTLAAGQEATVTYTAVVNPDGARGDDVLGNFLVNPGDPAPASCTPTNSQRPDCTTNPVGSITVVKASNPPSGATVEPGGQITYTLTFTNSSALGAASVDHTDHLDDVLDDAALTGVPTSSSGALSATIEGTSIRVTGSLAPGQTVTVTYIVTLKPYNEQGNHQLNNIVAPTGQPPVCAPGSGLCTTHVANQAITPPPPPATTPPTTPEPGQLPATGGDTTPLLQLTVLLAGLGLVLVATSRRRRRPAR